MSNESNYQRGHSVHFIQARKALEASGQWKPTTVIEIGQGVITLQLGDVVASYLCGDTSRLQGVFDTGRVALNANGEHIAQETLITHPSKNGVSMRLRVICWSWNGPIHGKFLLGGTQGTPIVHR